MNILDNYNPKPEVQSISSLLNDLSQTSETPINLNPEYQRNVVWDDDKQSKYIESIFIGFSPTCLIFTIDNNGKTCVDGKQRCTSIINFKNNKICVVIDDIPYFYGPTADNITEELKEKYTGFKIMTQTERTDRFLYKTLNMVQYKDLSYEQQLDLFHRLQFGAPLEAGELVLAGFNNVAHSKIIHTFCDDNKALLKIHIKRMDRKAHYLFLIEVMYVLDEGLQSINKTKRTIFQQNLNNNKKKLLDLIKKTQRVITYVFTDDLLNSPAVQKMNQNVLLAVIYIINKKFGIILNELNKSTCDKIVKTINSTINTITNEKKVLTGKSDKDFKEIHNIFNKYYEKNNTRIIRSIPIKKIIIHDTNSQDDHISDVDDANIDDANIDDVVEVIDVKKTVSKVPVKSSNQIIKKINKSNLVEKSKKYTSSYS